MALLGRTTLLVSAMLAVAMPAVCLFLWSRMRGPAAVRFIGRAALLVCCQLAAVLFAALALNDFGTFYASWTELVRAGTNAGPASAPAAYMGARGSGSAGTTPVTIPSSSGGPPGWRTLGWSTRKQWPQRGAIVVTDLGGGPTGLSEQAYVYLPPVYFTGGPAARSMPVVEVLSGYPGHQANLVGRLRYPDRLLSAMRSHQANPMILVMMRPSPTFPWDTECTDVPKGPQAFTYFAQDVPAAVTAQFGLRTSAYGVIGDSTGGYCAVKLAMMAPTRFTAAVALSGYFAPATDRSTRGIFAHHADLRNHNDLGWRLRHLPAPKVSALIATSATETGLDGYDVAQRWLRLVRAPMSVDEYVLPHGGHNFKAWSRELPTALPWLSLHLAPPTRSG
jgi:S-formylglutathione hydrolase FrmB